MPEQLEALQQSAQITVEQTRAWFEQAASSATRDDFAKKGGLKDDGTGAVYAYFNSQGLCLYVGQTGRTVKARQHDQTSPHKKKEWWPEWTELKFVQQSQESQRLLLEILLIQAHRPKHNVKPEFFEITEWLSK
ncbi:hypothetical protein SAMN04488540_1085 [Ferrimonas sediminum]|uniref:GIY-YIG domain-containing protein n=1 Tax=Ferrimonas sediminum TaxID=718193 RepID=A0A1G8TJC9_9GAMM|nr:hypothetical protein [Ferrimonas sediminum]SDJ41669.1 hypothetical protein SAMN04488540_1085 [Ferrimonas sediminum]